MITEYKILSDVSLFRLQDEVNMAIKQGWQPLGGLDSVSTKLDKNFEPNEDGELTVLHAQALGR